VPRGRGSACGLPNPANKKLVALGTRGVTSGVSSAPPFKALKAFIEEIPDSSLEALPISGGTIYSNYDFRLDMQGVS